METTGASLDRVDERRLIVVAPVQPRHRAFHRRKDAFEASVICFANTILGIAYIIYTF